MAQKGSIEWLREIATTLGDHLLGLEMSDYRPNGDVTPIVQVLFVVPFFRHGVPREVEAAAQITGYSGMIEGNRGRHGRIKVFFLYFDFGKGEGPFPEKEDVLAVAKEFGLTYSDSFLNNDHNLQRALPSLYNS